MSTQRDVKGHQPSGGEKRVTLADVARRAGVSQTAASFVLTGRREDQEYSAEVEARVLQAAQETGYRPNIVSRSLRTGTTRTIGFISRTPIATTPFAGDLIKGALEAARDRGYLLLIAETEGDGALEQQLLEAVIDRQVDGIVLASMYTRRLAVPSLLKTRAAVLLNAVPARPAPLISVIPDEVEAGRAAAENPDRSWTRGRHLPRRSRTATKPGATTRRGTSPVERLQGINETLARAGLKASGAIACVEWQPELGQAAVQTLLNRGAQIKALICFNDRLALGAIQRAC